MVLVVGGMAPPWQNPVWREDGAEVQLEVADVVLRAELVQLRKDIVAVLGAEAEDRLRRAIVEAKMVGLAVRAKSKPLVMRGILPIGGADVES